MPLIIDKIRRIMQLTSYFHAQLWSRRITGVEDITQFKLTTHRWWPSGNICHQILENSNEYVVEGSSNSIELYIQIRLEVTKSKHSLVRTLIWLQRCLKSMTGIRMDAKLQEVKTVLSSKGIPKTSDSCSKSRASTIFSRITHDIRFRLIG